MTFFLFLSCAPEYNLKLDTITGALQSLESQNVQIDAYCGFMMNASEAQYSAPERALGELFVRPDYCQEAETDNFECNWYPLEESFFDILEYDLNTTEEIVYDYGLQHQDSFEDRMLLSILGAELPVDTVYRLIGTVKKRGFVFDNSIASQTVNAFLENSPQEPPVAYTTSLTPVLPHP